MPVDVLILKSWVGGGRLSEQWPESPPAEFSHIRFHFDDRNTRADYVIVLNSVRERQQVICPPEHVWALMQEPPTSGHRRLHQGVREFRRIYTTDSSLTGERYRAFWGAMEWHVGLSFEELLAQPYPTKAIDLAWVTSNLRILPGHRKRLAFLRRLQESDVEVDLWGRGFKPLERKWDVLSRSRYSIAFENCAGTPYWSEKLSDCFLSFSTPLYYGSSGIDRYFPAGSYVLFDPDSRSAIEKIKDYVGSNFHEENIDALREARERCLRPYNTLFFIAREICTDSGEASAQKTVILRPTPGFDGTVSEKLLGLARGIARMLLPKAAFDWLKRRYRDIRDRER